MGFRLDDRPVVPQLLARARRRCFTNLLLEQCAVALAIAMGGGIILLLSGTQILNWYWIVLLAAGSLGFGLYRLRKTIPSTYELAQRIDRRLTLADALSTATYFALPEARGDQAIRERQRQEAEEVARTIQPNIAVPYTRPKYAYQAIALFAVACGLFVLRYAVTGSLSLQPSMVKIAFDTFFPPQPQMAKAQKPRDNRKPPMDQGDPDSSTVEKDQAPDQPLQANDAPDPNNPQAADNSKEAAQKGQQEKQSPDQQGENADKGDKQQGNDADQQNQQNNSKDGQQPGKQDSKQGSESENSSLMDKLKDAMSNMMNKMKSQQKDSQPQSAQNQKSQQDKSGQQSKQGQQDKQNANADAQSDQTQTNNGDPKQSADAKNGEKSSDKNASDDSKSGIGAADGDKSAKEAEQLAAMGKISEIIGKRSQNVTGEVMVEVGQSKQQLKTPWAQKEAAHAEAGSEVHRDEVPLMYQQFVQQYFEEIRRGAPSAKTPEKN
jgi:hypothetical protein